MKTFQLYVACIYCASITIGIVLGTPEKHTASDGREYLIATEFKYNWFKASHECKRRNSQLAIIDSEEKNDALVDLLANTIGVYDRLWLGGNDEFNASLEIDRLFFWSPTGEQFTFTNWVEKEPNNGGSKEHCVHIYGSIRSYRWNDEWCDKKLGFICELKPDLETCNKKLTPESNVVDKINVSDVFLNELNSKLQTLEQAIEGGKVELQKLQNIIESAVQKLIDKHEQNQFNALSGQMQRSPVNANYEASIPPAAYPFKNVVVINQGV
ncbi:hypothetical protein DOY81_003735 [Sarcophaga bullata]|nr:hypothetical protein DOY81_003735 [Sarcophaga bullata]